MGKAEEGHNNRQVLGAVGMPHLGRLLAGAVATTLVRGDGTCPKLTAVAAAVVAGR